MRVQGLFVDAKTKTPVVTLAEVDGDRRLPIWIGPGEASAIAGHLHGLKLHRPLTHDLAASLVVALEGRVTAARIRRVEEGLYYAEIVLERDEDVRFVDARPSDAIAVALRAGAEILVAEDLFWPVDRALPEPLDPS